jgi:hypothetical protein
MNGSAGVISTVFPNIGTKMRPHIPMRTKLAALAAIYLELPHEIAKELSEDDVIAMLGEWDHYPHRYADGGGNQFWNLRPMFAADHKRKTKLDAKDMAKERKVRRAHAKHISRMTAKRGLSASPRPSRWPKRPFPKRKKGWLRTRVLPTAT